MAISHKSLVEEVSGIINVLRVGIQMHEKVRLFEVTTTLLGQSAFCLHI